MTNLPLHKMVGRLMFFSLRPFVFFVFVVGLLVHLGAGAMCLQPDVTMREGGCAPVQVTGSRLDPYNEQNYSSINYSTPGGFIPVAGGIGGAPGRGEAQRDKNTATVGSLCPSAEKPAVVSNNPVIVATGEKFLPQVDFSISGLGAFVMKRTWRQFPVPASIMPSFGVNWASSLDYGGLSYYRQQKSGKYRAPPSITRIDADGGRVVYSLFEEFGSTEDDPWPTAGRYSANGAKYGEIYYNATTDVATLTTPGSTLVFTNLGRIKSYAANDGSVDYLFVYQYFGANLRVGSLLIRGRRSIGFSYYPNGLVQTVTAPNGGVWTYAYDGQNRLTRVTSPELTYIDYLYDGGSTWIVGYSVNGARKTKYVYDGSTGRVISSGTFDGERVDAFGYTATTATLTNELGLATTYTYSTINGARMVTGVSSAGDGSCPSGASSLEYDANGYVKATVDKANVRNEYSYDASGYLQKIDEAKATVNARSTINEWDTSGRLRSTTYRDAASNALLVRTFNYVGSTDTVQSIIESDPRNGSSRTTSFTVTKNGSGRMIRYDVTKSGIGTESWYYDDVGNLTATTNAAGQTINYAGHNGLGLPTIVTDINGLQTSYGYDLRGLKTSATLSTPSGSRTTYWAWTPEGLLKQQTDPAGLVTDYIYTASSDRLTQVSDSLGNVINYDRSGRLFTTSVALKAPYLEGNSPSEVPAGSLVSAREVNIKGDLWKLAAPSGQKQQNSFDVMGRLTTSQ
ncbi:MAG: RHS repeat protein, partial [Cupriavidus sp.]